MLIKILANGCCQKKGLKVRLFTVGKRKLQSVTNIVRLASPPPLFNVG